MVQIKWFRTVIHLPDTEILCNLKFDDAIVSDYLYFYEVILDDVYMW